MRGHFNLGLFNHEFVNPLAQKNSRLTQQKIIAQHGFEQGGSYNYKILLRFSRVVLVQSVLCD